MKVVIEGNELYHHGILGQKWGKRRWQNEDGSLTEEGRKRYLKDDGTLTRSGKRKLASLRKEQAKVVKKAEKAAKKEAKKAEKEEKKQQEIAKKAEEAKKKKPISEMTDQELNEFIYRKTAEKNALQLMSDINKLTPAEEKSAGRQLVEKLGNTFWKDVASPSLNKAADKFITKLIDGTTEKTEQQKLDDDVKRYKAKADIAKSQADIIKYTNQKNNPDKNSSNKDIEQRINDLSDKLDELLNR